MRSEEMASAAAPPRGITAEEWEESAIFIGRYFAGMTVLMVGFFVFSALLYMDVVPNVTKYDKIIWGVFGIICLFIAAFIVRMLLQEDSPCNRRNKINKGDTC